MSIVSIHDNNSDFHNLILYISDNFTQKFFSAIHTFDRSIKSYHNIILFLMIKYYEQIF